MSPKVFIAVFTEMRGEGPQGRISGRVRIKEGARRGSRNIAVLFL